LRLAIAVGLEVSRRRPEMICARMRSTSVLSKMRRCQRSPQQFEGLILVILQHTQRAAERIACRAEIKFDGAAVEPLMVGVGIQIARAFIDQTGDHIADTWLVGRVL